MFGRENGIADLQYRSVYSRAVKNTRVPKPQSATPTRRIDHSDGLSAHTLPSFTTYASTDDTFSIFASTSKPTGLVHPK